MTQPRDVSAFFDDKGRPTQAYWNDFWLRAERVSLETLDAYPDRCAIDGCVGPNLRAGHASPGDIEWGPLSVPVSFHCIFHAQLMGQYGEPQRPRYLDGLPLCSHDEPSPPSDEVLRCSEPAVANGLCTVHVSANRFPWGYEDVLDAVKDAWLPDEQKRGPVTDDTRRVLSEIKRIAKDGPPPPDWPMSPWDVFAGFGAAMFFRHAGPRLEERAKAAFWMSPFSIGRTLNIPADQVEAHIVTLKVKRRITPDADLVLPKGFVMVVQAKVFTADIVRRIRRDRLRNLFPSRYTKIAYGPPPRKGTEIFEPIADGPGLVAREFRGTAWELTSRGEVDVQAWHETLAREARRVKEDKVGRRVGVAALLIGFASLVSVTSDAPAAVKNIGRALGHIAALVQQSL
ncbi:MULTISPECIES: hypothetical protein [Frigoribacterium]|uniref:hypothetical protein n=1 Tax=Frigoribacterium TaxID=96492 RepID=UPI0024131DE0|nr:MULTISPECIES: hypothetical protein [Frigoribacterium]